MIRPFSSSQVIVKPAEVLKTPPKQSTIGQNAST
jgi:hypothetical protein